MARSGKGWARFSQQEERKGMTAILRPPFSDPALAENIFNSIVSLDNIKNAYMLVRGLSEASGFEGVTPFEEGLESNLLTLHRELATLEYKPSGMYHLNDIKPEKEWIAEFAVLLVIRELFESDFFECSHGSSRGKGLPTAAEQIEEILEDGYHWIVNINNIAWINNYISVMALTNSVLGFISDDKLCTLLMKMFPVDKVMRDDLMTPGTFRGSPLITLLYNVYMHQLDEYITQRRLKYVRCNHLAFMFLKERKDAERAYHEVHSYLTGPMGLESKFHDNQVLALALKEADIYLAPFYE
jgi:hypothetical protein